MRYVVGVDLGTTYTGAAVGRGDHVEMCSLGNRSVVAPAVVFAHDGGRLMTGDAAARRALDQPDRSAREYKRRLGDPAALLLGGAPYSPAILMATVLGAAVEQVSEVNGEPPEKIVLTRPAVWGPYRREQFDEVPVLGGLSGVQMVPEPVAAATYYAATKANRDDQVIAVYDLGGGTFDATVVQLRDGDVQVLGDPQGIEWLGGIDFDQAVLGYVDRELGGAVSALDLNDSRDAGMLIRLRQECTLAKEALSVEDEVTIRAVLPQGETSVRLTRADFEERIHPALNSTIEALYRVLESAAVTAPELSAVLLVGGSSRIPLVSRLLETALHRPIAIDTHPKHAVALGAAMIANRMLGPAGSAAGPTSLALPAAPAALRELPGPAMSTGGADGEGVEDQGRPQPSSAVPPPPRRPAGLGVWRRFRHSRAPLVIGAVAALALLTVGVVTAVRADDGSGGAVTQPPPGTPATSSLAAAGAGPVSLPPVNGRFDDQIGGAYPPASAVTIVDRDHDDGPMTGKYNICYVNAFQTQPDEASFWTGSHSKLLLKDGTKAYVTDPDSGGYLLDTSTGDQRKAIATVIDGWIDDCAHKGFQAVDPDQLDSWTRSKGLLTQADNVALATLLAGHAHEAGLAIAQQNTAQLSDIGKTTVGFDFAIAEECQRYDECDDYTGAYGNRVIEIEYTAGAYAAACAARGSTISVIDRDPGVVPKGENGYLYRDC